MTSLPRITRPSFRLRKSSTVAFSPSGRYLAQIGARVFVWDTAAREIASQFKPLANECHLVFSPDEQTVAIKNTNGEIAFCDISSGRVLSQTGKLKANRAGGCPAFTADGKCLVDGSWDGELRLIEVATSLDATVRHFGTGYMFGDIVSTQHSLAVALNAKQGTRGGSRLLLLDARAGIDALVDIAPGSPHHQAGAGWRWISQIALHPSGSRAALYFEGRAPDESSVIARVPLDQPGQSTLLPLTSRTHRVRALAWSARGVLCACVHERPNNPTGGYAAWQRLKASSEIREHLHFYADDSESLRVRWPWQDAQQVAFSPDGTAFAVASHDIPGACFADFHLTPLPDPASIPV